MLLLLRLLLLQLSSILVIVVLAVAVVIAVDVAVIVVVVRFSKGLGSGSGDRWVTNWVLTTHCTVPNILYSDCDPDIHDVFVDNRVCDAKCDRVRSR